MVLIARDEAARIERCLSSLTWVDEIVVVVDDRTTDETAAIARRFTGLVFVRPFVDYAAQRQWGQEQARSAWILWIDCDEVVSPALALEVREASLRPGFGAFRVPHLDYMFGRWIRHGGWYPQYHLRLFRRAGATWTSPVHEAPRVTGGIGTLREAVLHFSHARVKDWVNKMAHYTTLEADMLHRSGARSGVLRLLIEPPAYFGYKYFVQQGWRDGMHGLALALLLGCYRLVRNLKLWDLQQAERGPRESANCPPSTPRS